MRNGQASQRTVGEDTGTFWGVKSWKTCRAALTVSVTL